MRRLLASCLSLAACDFYLPSPSSAPDASPDATNEFPDPFWFKQDLLFVVDNSRSMELEEGALAPNFGLFANVLETIQGGLPDIHIGVVTSDLGAPASHQSNRCTAVGDTGFLQVPAGCPALTDGKRFISDVYLHSQGGARVRNYPEGELAATLACISQVGTTGCGLEQPMNAALRGVDPEWNPGFRRPDAYLAVIFLTDEDDCSVDLGSWPGDWWEGNGEDLTDDHCGDHQDALMEVSELAEQLRALGEDPSRIIVAAATGGPAGCSVDGLAAADPAPRLEELLDQFPQRSTLQDFCAVDPNTGLLDWSGVLTLVATRLQTLQVGAPE